MLYFQAKGGFKSQPLKVLDNDGANVVRFDRCNYDGYVRILKWWMANFGFQNVSTISISCMLQIWCPWCPKIFNFLILNVKNTSGLKVELFFGYPFGYFSLFFKVSNLKYARFLFLLFFWIFFSPSLRSINCAWIYL